jgi:PEP-CTERM motif
MKRLTKRTILVPLAVIIALHFGARPAIADSITYTESAKATGLVVNGSSTTPFAGVDVTITVLGDPADVIGSALLTNTGGAGSVTIDGFPTYTILGIMQAFVNQTALDAGITDISTGETVDTLFPTFHTYDLASSFGPVSGPGFSNPAAASLVTTGGTVILELFDSDTTFTATTSSGSGGGGTNMPEPSSFALLAAGILGLGMMVMRKHITRRHPQAT